MSKVKPQLTFKWHLISCCVITTMQCVAVFLEFYINYNIISCFSFHWIYFTITTIFFKSLLCSQFYLKFIHIVHNHVACKHILLIACYLVVISSNHPVLQWSTTFLAKRPIYQFSKYSRAAGCSLPYTFTFLQSVVSPVWIQCKRSSYPDPVCIYLIINQKRI